MVEELCHSDQRLVVEAVLRTVEVVRRLEANGLLSLSEQAQDLLAWLPVCYRPGVPSKDLYRLALQVGYGPESVKELMRSWPDLKDSTERQPELFS